MKKMKFCIIIILLLCACDDNNDYSTITLESPLTEDSPFTEVAAIDSQDILELQAQNLILRKKIKTSAIIKANDLSLAYINYLNQLTDNCKGSDNPLCKDGEDCIRTAKGEEFVIVTRNYLLAIEPVFSDFKIQERASQLLNIDGIVRKEEMIVLFYVDYYFKGVECDAFNYLINIRKRNVLLLQNELMYRSLLSEAQ